MNETQKLQALRVAAALKRPYFASALFAMQLVSERRVERMAVDQHGRIYVNPDFVVEGDKKPKKGQYTMEQGAWGLIHELAHWLRKHHARAAGVVEGAPIERRLWVRDLINIAEDLEINDDLIAEGAKLPNTVHPKTYKLPENLLWEEYYELLKKQAPPPITITVTICDCGSGAHGVPMEYELPGPSGDKAGGIGEAEGDLIRRQVAMAIRDYDSRYPGDVAAGWKRWAETLLQPAVVPWERELAALIRNAVTMSRGAVDYSYTKVSRRGSFAGVLMPALVRPEPDATIVLDTSGSMDNELLAAALRETEGILKACGQRKIPVLCCDAAVHGGVQRVSKALQIELSGGGGTDMGVGIAAAQKLKSKVVIVLTDGFTPWPTEAPTGVQLVVGILGPTKGMEKSYAPPPYAKRVLYIRSPKGDKAAA